MYPVSNHMVAVLVFNVLVSISTVLLFIVFKKRYGCMVRSFSRAATFVIFTLVLSNCTFFGVPICGGQRSQNIWLYALTVARWQASLRRAGGLSSSTLMKSVWTGITMP